MKKVKIEIKTFGGSVLFTFNSEENTIKKTLEKAVLEGAYLRGAVLEGADLRGAYLRGADLRGAYLRGAVLEGADLRGAVLEGADLRGAVLEGAYLRGADLRGAYLRGADLRGAYLRGAVLEGAYLRGAVLEGADLRDFTVDKLPVPYVNAASRDMLFIFQCLKGELPFLREKLIKGEIDGSVYEGDCACLIGTLANADGGLEEVCQAIPYYDKGTHNPAEDWFLKIRKGDTPETNDFARHALMLVDRVMGKKVKKLTKKK